MVARMVGCKLKLIVMRDGDSREEMGWILEKTVGGEGWGMVVE